MLVYLCQKSMCFIYIFFQLSFLLFKNVVKQFRLKQMLKNVSNFLNVTNIQLYFKNSKGRYCFLDQYCADTNDCNKLTVSLNNFLIQHQSKRWIR
ncbi:unnamed protein product [Paramecium sonneborni]|uniref:Uncharacterized protein n=1 Tax=Paramecium sonneborni TaxID=65129 RepID=A0A8S1RR72_9CILI|nr:unnamed protein product [Paramecium sonneborni]